MDIKEIAEGFQSPGYEYGLVPFWFWNDGLEPEHILFQIEEMYEKGVRQFIIHSRLGRTVEYLSETWFERIELALREAKSRGMGVWIYDEDNWPSGYAAERVLRENENFCAKHLKRYPLTGELPPRAKEISRDSQYRYVLCDTYWHPAYSESYYTDLLNPAATDAFIRCTHAEYYARFGGYFATGIVKGFFVDEPGFYNNFNYYEYRGDADSVVFTDALPEYFAAVKGYDLLPHLSELWGKGKESLPLKRDFYDVVTRMYTENFFGRIADFCHKAGVLLIGHEHSEEFIPYHLTTQGDLMRAMAAQDYAGIDRIDLTEGKATEKYASSVAHMYGKPRAMSETFASSGLDLDLRRIKRWTNYQYVRGINMLVPHAFFSSVSGDRKWECPPSLFYQNMYWRYFGTYADYVRRLSWLLTRGNYGGCAALYYPITTVMEKLDLSDFSAASQYDRTVVEIAETLTQWQIDFDFINDEALLSAKIDGHELEINGSRYKFIVLPDITNLPEDTLRRLKEYAQAGGGIVALGKCDYTCLEGDTARTQSWKKAIEKSARFYKIDEFQFCERYSYAFDGQKVRDYAERFSLADVRLRRHDSAIRYHKRDCGEVKIYFFFNESCSEKTPRIFLREKGAAYRLDPYGGDLHAIPFEQREQGTEIHPLFQPWGEAIIAIVAEGAEMPADLSLKLQIPCVPGGSLWAQGSIAEGNLRRIREEAFLTSFTITADGWKRCGKLDYWSEYGQPYYSGFAMYSCAFTLQPERGRRYFLRLDELHCTAEVTCNGKAAGVLLWEPYCLDITGQIRGGANELRIAVANTTANALYRQDFDSGLVGGVSIISAEEG